MEYIYSMSVLDALPVTKPTVQTQQRPSVPDL